MINMTCGIYKITNIETGSIYIGQSIDCERRKKDHFNRNLMDTKLHKAIVNEGTDKFSFEILEELPLDINVLNEREEYYISKYNAFENPKHYNQTKGGDNREYTIGFSQYEYVKEAISQANAGEKNGRYKGGVTITKNGFVNGKQQYCLRKDGKVITRSCSKEKLQKIKNGELSLEENPHIIKNGWGYGKNNTKKQEYAIVYKGQYLCYSTNLQKLKSELKKINVSELNIPPKQKRVFNPSKEYKLKMSKKNSKTGFYRVTKNGSQYRYWWKEEGKRKTLCSVDIDILKEKVIDEGLEWVDLNEI